MRWWFIFKRKRPDPNRPFRTEISERANSLRKFFCLVGLAIVGFMLYTQYGPDAVLLRAEAKNENNFKYKTNYALRGDILSYDGRVLSTTLPSYHIHMDFRAGGLHDTLFKKEAPKLGEALSNFFKDKSAKEYTDFLKEWYDKGSRYKRISPRRIDYIELREVVKFPLFCLGRNKSGFMLDTLNKRVMPHGSLARRTIGKSSKDGGNYGLEDFFDKELKGVDGLSAIQKVSGNFWIPVQDEKNSLPIDGYDVVSTLDIEVQRVAEDALRSQLTDNEAIWGTAILMEVESGEIRAIANLSRDEKNHSQYYEDYNHAIGKNMEPGSTFKAVSLMALLDDAKVSINEIVNTGGGRERIGAATVVDTKTGGYGKISLERAFEVSSNIGFAKMINKYYGARPEKFVDYINKLGLTRSFDLQVAGEKETLLRKPGDRYWDGTTLTMMSFGYAIMMTPLRTLSIYNAVANNGEYVSPRLVREIKDHNTTIKRFPKEVINEKICSNQALEHIKRSMEGVVNDGTAKRILLNPNYKVAAKTGTAQVAKGRYGYSTNGGKYYLATVVGYFPADNPKYSCIVAIETFRPNNSNKTYYGGSLSGPVFRAIADKVYSQSPEWANSISKPTAIKANTKNQLKRVYDLPEVKAGVNSREKNVQSELKVYGIADTVRREVGGGVPNLKGMALRDAMYILESKGLYVNFEGQGRVVDQSLVAGESYVKSDTIKLVLR